MISPWTVSAWPTVLWQADATLDLHFVHLGTRVLNEAGDAGPYAGQTLWGESSGDLSAGVAWDWVLIQQGVVALADPMGMVTNLQFVDAHGEALAPRDMVVHLNEIVHALPWQTEVCRALRQPAA